MQADKADKVLVDHHLEIGRITSEYSQEKEGVVIATDPSTGKLRVGEHDRPRCVSKGPQPVAVPDVTRMKLEEAVSTLEGAGFATTVTNAYSDEIEEGYVIQTEPRRRPSRTRAERSRSSCRTARSSSR